jgi:mannose-6-phosphate isomerase-like protein (cupin superfamily)
LKIPGVIHRKAKLAHEDDRRYLFSVFNGDLANFTAVQLKWFDFKANAMVGKHYHDDYDEVFCIVRGGGLYELVYVDDPDQREKFIMKEGDMILVPRRVAHRARVRKGSIIIAANSEIYISPEASDFSFDFGGELTGN